MLIFDQIKKTLFFLKKRLAQVQTNATSDKIL